jgi:hypothetical protein
MVLWELETCRVPFEGIDRKDLKKKLLDERVRPLIPDNTDEYLKRLIR